ncbi:MAG: invasion associated locus B family protein [Hyphomicrobiales bacterium]|nr:invasion associated locus B family protein [Hyphomicrobiales bacterium]
MNWISGNAPYIMAAMPQPLTTSMTLIALAAAAAIAALDGTTAQEVAAWRVECTGDGKVLDCRALQQVFQRIPNQGDRLLVAVLVRRPADPKAAPQMTLQLPLGLNLTEPVQIRVDGGPVERQPMQTCTNIGCFAAMPINEKLLAAMRSGKDLRVTVQDPNKKSLDMALPLLGFSLAFDRLKP